MLVGSGVIKSIASGANYNIFAGKNVLVTGATGMIGSFFAETLWEVCQLQGTSPKRLDLSGRENNSSNLSYLLSKKDVEFRKLDFRNESEFRDYHIIIHAASPASPKNFDKSTEIDFINYGCLPNMISTHVEKFFFISTGEVYGNVDKLGILESDHINIDPLLKRSVYPLAKSKGEEIGLKLCVEKNVDFLCARLFHTFGPGIRRHDGRSFADFLYSVADGKFPMLNSPGNDIRSFQATSNAAHAFMRILQFAESSETFNVGDPVSMSIREFATLVSEIGGLFGKLFYNFDADLGFEASPNHKLVPNIDRLRNLGWFSVETLEENIRRTLRWIISQNN